MKKYSDHFLFLFIRTLSFDIYSEEEKKKINR